MFTSSSHVLVSNALNIVHSLRRYFVLFVLYASLFLATMIGMMAPFVVQWMQVCALVHLASIAARPDIFVRLYQVLQYYYGG